VIYMPIVQRMVPGTYACDCFPGYEGDGIKCTQSEAMLKHLEAHDEHLSQIDKLQKRLAELESVNPHKARESAQQKEIDMVRESLATLEKTTEQLIHSSDAQRETIKKILEKSQQQPATPVTPAAPAMLETNTQLKKNMRRVRIDDRN